MKKELSGSQLKAIVAAFERTQFTRALNWAGGIVTIRDGDRVLLDARKDKLSGHWDVEMTNGSGVTWDYDVDAENPVKNEDELGQVDDDQESGQR